MTLWIAFWPWVLVWGQTWAFQSCVEPPNLNDNYYEVKFEGVCSFHCQKASNCSAYLFKELDQFVPESDLFPGNCVLLNEFEDNFFIGVSHLGDYKIHLHMIYERTTTFPLLKPNSFDTNFLASWHGYNITLEDESTKQTLFFKAMSNEVSYDQAERICAQESGTLPMAYSKEIRQSLQDTLGSVAMPLGLRILTKSDSTVDTVWSNGHIHWRESLAGIGTCPAYDGWTTTDWNTNTFAFLDATGALVSGNNDTYKFTGFLCQYVGFNLGVGSRITVRDDDPAFSNLGRHVVDNEWNVASLYTNTINQWISGSNGDGISWVVIDFSQSYAVKMFRVQVTPTGDGDQVLRPRFYVGYNRGVYPEGGAFLQVDDNFGFCGQSDYQGQDNWGIIIGFTCNRWYIGKFAAILNGVPQKMAISEIAIYGFPYLIFDV